MVNNSFRRNGATALRESFADRRQLTIECFYTAVECEITQRFDKILSLIRMIPHIQNGRLDLAYITSRSI
jgi:hypothetical protein